MTTFHAVPDTTNPPCPDGQYEYKWDADIDENIVCHFEYDDENGYRNDYMHLTAAYIRGLDIFGLLTSEQIDTVASLALAEANAEAKESCYP